MTRISSVSVPIEDCRGRRAKLSKILGMKRTHHTTCYACSEQMKRLGANAPCCVCTKHECACLPKANRPTKIEKVVTSFHLLDKEYVRKTGEFNVTLIGEIVKLEKKINEIIDLLSH